MIFSDKVKRISISQDMTLLQALKLMDELDKKLLLVFEKDKFTGLLSIGDIQRAIIKNLPLDSSVLSAMRTNIRVSRDSETRESIKERMLEFRMECIPVLNNDGELTDVLFWEDEFTDQQLKPEGGLEGIPVVIMAGGFGSRLKPLTNIIPKPLVPIGEKPIVEIIIDRFHRLGVNDFYLSVNYKHEMIRYYFDHLEGRSYNVSYFMEDRPLGTAGSIFLLKSVLKSTFFVSNCDILIEQDYRDIYQYHKSNQNLITLVGSLKHHRIPYGTLETGENGILVGMKEKPEVTYLINSGMYVLEPEVLDQIPDNTFMHITELIEKVKSMGGKVGVFPVSEKAWLDIGEWQEYQHTLAVFEKRGNK